MQAGYADILLADAGVRTDAGSSCRCPLCPAGRLSLADDSLDPGGRWVWCADCGFSGDAVSLLARKTGRGEHEVARRLGGEETRKCYERRKSREAAGELWASLRSCLTSFPSRKSSLELNERLKELGLWEGWNSGWREGMSGFLGGGLRDEVHKILGSDILPSDGFGAVLAVAYQDLPGRVRAFGLVGEGGALRIHQASEGRSEKACGLAFVGRPPPEEIVWACPDLKSAMNIQRRQMFDYGVPAPVVIYSRQVPACWSSLGASEVVFWDSELTVSTFREAAAVGRARVVGEEKPGNFADGRVGADSTPGGLTQALLRHARPWRQALAYRLLDLPDPQAFLRQLPLRPSDRRELMEACPITGRGRLAALLGSVEIPAAEIAGRRVVELADGSWAVRSASGADDVICDASFRVEKESTDRDGRVWWRGEYRCGDKIVRWADSRSAVEVDTVGWMTSAAAKSGLPQPVVSKAWRDRLLRTALLLHPPEKDSAGGPVRIGSFRNLKFPRFTASAEATGNLRGYVDAAACIGPDVFGGSITFPEGKRERADCDRTTPVLAFHMLLAGAYAKHLLDIREGKAPACIAVIGGIGSVGRSCLEHFSAAADVREGDWSAYPCRRNLKKWPEPGKWPAGAWLLLEPEEAAAAEADPNGPVLLRGGRDRTGGHEDPPFGDVLRWLHDLRARKWAVEAEVRALALDFCLWRKTALQDRTDKLWEAASIMSKPRRSPGDALLRLAAVLASCGRLTVRAGKIAASARGSSVLVGADCVRIPRKALVQATEGLPVPDWEACHKDLADRGLLRDGGGPGEWIVGLLRWEAADQDL